MKKFATLFFVIIAVSCKKSSSSPSYQVTASIDGTATNFNITPTAVRLFSSGITEIGITGVTSVTTGETIQIAINNSNNSLRRDSIVAGVYSDTSSLFTVEAIYFPNPKNTGTDYEAGDEVALDAFNTGTTLINHLKVVISSIDKTSVKGTFSGDLYYYGDISANKKTFTSGSFYTKFQ